MSTEQSENTTPALRPGRPNRDRSTWITYIQLSCFAWFMYGFGATQALLRDEQGTTRAVSALHSTSLATAGIIAGLLTSRFIERFGRGVVLRLGSVGVIAGVVVYTVPSGAYPVTMLGAFIVSFFGTLMLITINAYLIDHQGPAGSAAITEGNGLASIAGLLAPLAIGIGAATFLGWRWGLLAVAVGLVVVEVWRGRSVSMYNDAHHAPATVETGKMPKGFAWSMVVVMCFLGAEFSLVYWGADLLRERALFGPAAAAASVAAVTGGMAIGRFGGARAAQTIANDRILKWSILIALIGFAMAWATQSGITILIGMLITGIGIGVHWPLGVARAVAASGGRTDRASALASVFGSMAIASAPFALGALADATSFHIALLLVPTMLVLSLVVMIAKPVASPITNQPEPAR